MQLTYDCIPCLLRQMNHAMRTVQLDDVRGEAALRDLLHYFLDADLHQSPPELSRGAWAVIARHAGTDDPYAEIKARYNRQLLALYPDLVQLIWQSPDPGRDAIKLAIAGNILDLAVRGIERDKVMAGIAGIEETPLAVDDSESLYRALSQARRLLYLGDNCGEIVLDKAYIAYLNARFPTLRVQYAVRGRPILNDVTRVDAEMVGLAEVAEVLDNGDGAPGTDLRAASAEFLSAFHAADVVIAKGQGNLESLHDVARAHVYFLLMAKCDVVSGALRVAPMSLICMEANTRPFQWGASSST